MSKINDYAAFVDQCTSDTSKDTTKMCDRVEYLRGDYTMQGNKVIDQEIDMARLMTALIGMMAESGEFAEVVKKKVFQADSKFSVDEIFHMKRELGDVLWYWVQGCKALGFTPDEVMDENIRKLESRYPNGFEVIRSEVREQGDI
jgi:NTP pyrophosphatase (non-canonical NTP hydrolase)|tara:strand:+ start:543 stop:977 length:435 start_codon:yes stop_codon:yes gene_type:complete